MPNGPSGTLVLATRCKSCRKVSAATVIMPPQKSDFPKQCSCGECKVFPLEDGGLNDIETAFSANAAIYSERANARIY